MKRITRAERKFIEEQNKRIEEYKKQSQKDYELNQNEWIENKYERYSHLKQLCEENNIEFEESILDELDDLYIKFKNVHFNYDRYYLNALYQYHHIYETILKDIQFEIKLRKIESVVYDLNKNELIKLENIINDKFRELNRSHKLDISTHKE